MEIQGLNPLYQTLADMMWACKDDADVKALIREYGLPAITVYELMIAAHYDDHIQTYEDVGLAQHIIDDLCK